MEDSLHFCVGNFKQDKTVEAIAYLFWVVSVRIYPHCANEFALASYLLLNRIIHKGSFRRIWQKSLDKIVKGI